MSKFEITYKVECLPEEEPIRGSFASGDDAQDEAHARELEAQLDRGNEWAWCTIRVTAEIGKFSGTDYLSCCSYKSEADFCSENAYWPDMKRAALADLERRLEIAIDDGKAAANLLSVLNGEATHG